MRLVSSSGTYSPASIKRLASPPRGVPWETLARKMSPVEIAGILKCSAMNFAWVPLPAPGGPMISRRIWCSARSASSAQESFVVALLQLALDLLHRVERDTHHEQDRRATERELLVRVDEHERDQGDQGDQTEVERARQRDAGQDV